MTTVECEDTLGMHKIGSQRAMAHEKAMAYVRLMLAPSGEAVLMGEPYGHVHAIGQDNLMSCCADDFEVLAACSGLAQLDPKAVCLAIRERPEALSTIGAWLAYTPCIGAKETPVGFDVDINFKSPEDSDTLQMTPDQTCVPYLKAVLGAVALLQAVARDAMMKAVVLEHLCGSRHFTSCLHRLVKLIGRYRMAAMSAPELAENQLALLARDALLALRASQRRVDACLDQPTRKLINGTPPTIPRAEAVYERQREEAMDGLGKLWCGLTVDMNERIVQIQGGVCRWVALGALVGWLHWEALDMVPHMATWFPNHLLLRCACALVVAAAGLAANAATFSFGSRSPIPHPVHVVFTAGVQLLLGPAWVARALLLAGGARAVYDSGAKNIAQGHKFAMLRLEIAHQPVQKGTRAL